MLPPFSVVRRLRPVDLVARVSAQDLPAGTHPLPRPAPFAAATAPVTSSEDGVHLSLSSGAHRFIAWYSPASGRTGLTIEGPSGQQQLRSRRHGKAKGATEVALTLTGRHLTVLTRTDDQDWQARARADLRDVAPDVDSHDAAWCQGLEVTGPDGLRAGGFGHLGFRDIRLVTDETGQPVRDGEHLLLSLTHAGPGFFDTGHTAVWSLHPETLDFRHRSSLFFRRPAMLGPLGSADDPAHDPAPVPGSRTDQGPVGNYGDHATHVVRHGAEWLVATSTWSDFDPAQPRIASVIARTTADVTRGEHLLAAEPLDLPTDGLDSVGVWDPHLVHDGERWLVAFVSAQKFFSFHPALAAGVDLGSLELLGADTSRVACEGVTLTRLPRGTTAPGHDDPLVLVASDGPDSPRHLRQQYPVFDLSVQQVGTLEAPHPSNLPWPTVVAHNEGWLMVTFDGTPYGGEILGYGTHGDVVVMRAP